MNKQELLMMIIMGIAIVAFGIVIVETSYKQVCDFCINKTGVQQADDVSIDCDATNRCCPFVQNKTIFGECLVN